MAEPVSHYLQRRRTRAQRPVILALGLAAIALLGSELFVTIRPLLIYNASASAPIGFYRVLPPGLFRRGELVLVRTPKSVRDLAAQRGYLPLGVPLVKRIAALSGDTVCIVRHVVRIDGRALAEQRATDTKGRPLPQWSGCRTLGLEEMFLLMAGVPDSFDGRYFGPVSARAVIGRLVPLGRP
ncbi:MAG: conjugative transfer signal peptidase TraF [Alphaproteobacteria bacterium]|nr:conjugative transfer signal peptidase TraF [Alphaproteobacteria bacterium]